MTKNDKLFKETLVRVGMDNMRGVVRLLDEGHTGIAERHTVGKLIAYVKDLEEKVGVKIPSSDNASIDKKFIKINEAGMTYYSHAGA